MPAYAYPILIRRENLQVHFLEERLIESDRLTLADLQFAGADKFTVSEAEDQAGYLVSVSRSRLETDEERDLRVAREEAYMAEYRRRQAARFQ